MKDITGAKRNFETMPTDDLLERRGLAATAISQAVRSITRNEIDIAAIDTVLIERRQDEAR